MKKYLALFNMLFCVSLFFINCSEDKMTNPNGNKEPIPAGFVLISAGTFTMGSPAGELGRNEDEIPHKVTFTNDFYLSATEVTNQQYADLAQWAFNNGYCAATSLSLQDNLDGSSKELLDLDGYGSEISFSEGTFTVDAGKEDDPAKCISWYGAVAYCDWLSLKEGISRAYNHDTWYCNGQDPYSAEGYRLPTEAEWEYACRAGSQTAFANGEITDTGCEDDVLNEIGWYCGNTPDRAHPVKQLIANEWDLYDMHGNIEEWCNDWYGSYNGDETNAVGPNTGTDRVVRGGNWDFIARACRSAFRAHHDPKSGDSLSGFRVCRRVRSR